MRHTILFLNFAYYFFVPTKFCINLIKDPHSIKVPKPVMVFIHGGGFVWGYGNMYRADYLINYDVILVTFNYRLNVFGKLVN